MISSTTSNHVEDQYSNTSRHMQRMQLQDISETSELYNNSPKDNLLNLIQRVADEGLRQDIRVELKRLVSDYDRLISVLQQRSDVLEQEYENLQMMEDSYQRRYEKAVREMQFFRKKYEKASELNKQYAAASNTRPRSPSIESSSSSLMETQQIHNGRAAYGHHVAGTTSVPISPPPSSSLSGSSEGTSSHFSPYGLPPPPPPLPPSILNNLPHHEAAKGRHLSRSSSSSTTSSNASGSPYWGGYSSEHASAQPPPVPRLRQNSNATTVGAASSIHSSSTEGGESNKSNSFFLQSRKGSWQHSTNSAGAPPTPPIQQQIPPHPSVSRSTTNASQAGYTNPSVVQQRKVDPLSFGGSDAFWETIAKSKEASSTMEKLISNFLRRGGSPNTAKQSSSHKSVKYGYGLLHTAVAMKAMGTLELLLQHGANPNSITLSQVEEDKLTPGYLAASMGWLPGLQALVDAGADITLSRGSGLKNKTALHVAAEHCHTTVVEYIVSLTPSKYHFQVDSMGNV
ncbi:MAG: hypothetical protein EXX96DRAFT_569336 [Benjaminiella poitrasii]|nr:MAG: hypothetical protein EXX96DRAFT_569336 [Benjaminiella poitrasii]